MKLKLKFFIWKTRLKLRYKTWVFWVKSEILCVGLYIARLLNVKVDVPDLDDDTTEQ